MNEELPFKESLDRALRLFQSDQADRASAFEEGGIQRMISNDSLRLQRGREIYNEYKEGKIILSGDNLYNLAMIFQHSRNAEDYKVAEGLASISAEQGNERAKWLSSNKNGARNSRNRRMESMNKPLCLAMRSPASLTQCALNAVYLLEPNS
ncbi:hypothetical protein HY972_01895 [Candidatus Kaiserbacteria bacterium]|nr:hypothetical protein [Candidatus Kaiserbacteria bacterium]